MTHDCGDQVLREDKAEHHEKQQISDPQPARSGKVRLPVNGIELGV